jgi:nucleoid-associated protein YgaU
VKTALFAFWASQQRNSRHKTAAVAKLPQPQTLVVASPAARPRQAAKISLPRKANTGAAFSFLP